MGQSVADLQLAVMQEFFKIRMTEAYGDQWIIRVKDLVEYKFDSNNKYRSNYTGIHECLRHDGVALLDEKKMDVTVLTTMMVHDFQAACTVGDHFQEKIENIRDDKNRLVSHITSRDDVLEVKILELTMLKNLRTFLQVCVNSDWNYPGKLSFAQKYLDQIEFLTADIFRGMSGESQEKIRFESNRRSYLERIIEERNGNAAEYIPLSYKVDDGTSQRFGLEELFDRPEDSQGFVLFSREAGYGKTWSVQELAGQCAEAALSDETGEKATPVLIKMGELAVHSEPLMKAIQEIFYPGEDSLEKARTFVSQEKVILFIDGMDEAKKDNKDSAWSELKKLMSSAKDIRIIGGTRESDIQWYPAELPRYSICSLTDKQVETYLDKLLLDKEQHDQAVYDYFENPKTAFLKNLRSPFYLKCYVGFVKEGESAPDSDTDMMNRFIRKMVEREISLKGFRATVEIVNQFLETLSGLIGNEERYIPEQAALREIRDSLMYDEENYASIVQIKDTLVELQILKEVTPSERQPVLLGFWHEKYKSLYSPVARNTSLWDY
jgi:hypothetical protein